MSTTWLSSPLIAMALYVAIAAGLYWWGGRWGARGPGSSGKNQPYACGEDFTPGETQLSYRRFYRLALLFVVVHVATLVVAMLPSERSGRLLGTLYLVGVAVCVDVLARG